RGVVVCVVSPGAGPWWGLAPEGPEEPRQWGGGARSAERPPPVGVGSVVGAMSLAVITDLAKYFGAELIFAGVSFRVEHHDRIGLVGPNGAGKSTLLKLLVGELAPDEGAISFAAGLRSGYLPQIADFHPARTLHDEMLALFA